VPIRNDAELLVASLHFFSLTMDEFPPEYVNASNAGRIVGVVGVFHIIAFAFVSLRVYVRLFMVKAFGIDDTLIIISAVSIRMFESAC